MIVLVTGSEMSGTRMMARMVTEAGGRAWQLPMPMTRKWPGAEGAQWHDFSRLAWDVALVMHRDPHCIIACQVRAGHVANEEEAVNRLRACYCEVYGQLAADGRPFWPVTYEGLAKPEAVTALMERLGLDGSKVVTRWQDANAKHYGGEDFHDHRRFDNRQMAVTN